MEIKCGLYVENLFLSALGKQAPTTSMRFRNNMAPCIASELKSLIRQRDYLKAKANKTGNRYLSATKLEDCFLSLERTTTRERLKCARVI